MSESDKDSGFALVAQRGAAKAEVRFSGGNDEGGVDEIRFLNAADEVISVENDWNEFEYPGALAPLCRPVEEQYMGFSGEFYVWGEVVWDLAARTVTMSGDEEVPALQQVSHTF